MTVTRGRLGWSAAAIFGPQILQFVGLLALGRLLTPGDFGAVALVTTIAEFATLLLNSGLSSYVVHSPTVRQSQLSTVFWVNFALGIVICAIVVSAAGLIAEIFNNPLLRPLVAISAVGFLFGIGATHLGLLQREYRFRAIALVETATMLVTQIGAIILGLSGLGAYSIVVARLGGLFIQVVLYFVASRWRPTLTLDRSALNEVWKYARHVLGFNVVNFWSRNLDNVIIARSAGADVLGFYSRAYSIMLLPVSLVGGALGRVLLPTLARQQHDLRLSMRTWTDYTLLSLFLGLPVVSLLVAGADPIVLVLLGNQWGGAGIYLQILGMSIVPQLVIRPLGFLFQALGRTGAQLYIGLATTTVTASFMLAGNFYASAVGVAVGFTAAYFVHLVIYLVYAKRRLYLEVWSFLMPAGRLFAAMVLATVGSIGVRISAREMPHIVQVGAIGTTVVGVYLLAVFILSRRTLTAAWRLVRGAGWAPA